MARTTPCLEHGKTCFVDFVGDRVGWGSTGFLVLRSKPPLAPEFAYLLARSPASREHAIIHMTCSSGSQRVSTSCFESFKVCVPPEQVARRFGDAVRPLFALIRARDEESLALVATLDALPPKLFAGEVRIAELFVGASA